MIAHVVFMKFIDAADAAQAKQRLEALPPQIEQIRSLQALIDVVGSEVSWHLALLTEHESLADLQAYQAHPAHQEFGAWVRPRLTSRAVVDGNI